MTAHGEVSWFRHYTQAHSTGGSACKFQAFLRCPGASDPSPKMTSVSQPGSSEKPGSPFYFHLPQFLDQTGLSLDSPSHSEIQYNLTGVYSLLRDPDPGPQLPALSSNPYWLLSTFFSPFSPTPGTAKTNLCPSRLQMGIHKYSHFSDTGASWLPQQNVIKEKKRNKGGAVSHSVSLGLESWLWRPHPHPHGTIEMLCPSPPHPPSTPPPNPSDQSVCLDQPCPRNPDDTVQGTLEPPAPPTLYQSHLLRAPPSLLPLWVAQR